MARIRYEDREFEANGNSVLDCLLGQGIAVPSACRAGVCQCCLMQARSGAVPARAQEGLTATMVARNLFLACQCIAEEDLEVAPAGGALRTAGARVCAVNRLAGDIAQVLLQPEQDFGYRAGQFVRLYRDADTSRNYSLASVPGSDALLELHVRRVPGGAVSNWVFDTLVAGDAVTISEASGNCCYVADQPQQNLLLLATGTGIAPLVGIVRDALRSGHAGQIRLYHGSPDGHGDYLGTMLGALAARHPRFVYRHCVSEAPPAPGQVAGTPPEAALRDVPDLTGWRVYLCGNPLMVDAGRIEAFLAGAASAEIFADPFVPSAGQADPVAA